jgi:outer membrane protein assembly factor BamB
MQNAPLVTPSTTFFCGNDEYLYAITTSSGQFLWRYQTGFGDGATPVLSADGNTV